MKHVTQPRPKPIRVAKKARLQARIDVLKITLAELEALPPILGVKWRDGMIRYYTQRLAELESYAADTSETK